MKILYITFIDFGDFGSGSSVRPQKMYDAFLELGHEVKLLEGLNNKLKQRRQRVKEILKWLKTNRPDICYVEPPSGPFFNPIDHFLLLKLRLKKVPIGLFYRDAYWKFADWWGKNGISKLILVAMHIFDSITFKFCCNIVYFPSDSMAKLFSFKARKALPPAGENNVAVKAQDSGHFTAFYIGEITKEYGSEILFEAIKIANERFSCNIFLKLVCRVDKTNPIIAPYAEEPWLSVIKASGESLKEIYHSVDFGVIPRKKDVYMDFAVPVKLMEYLSYGLPILATNCAETANFINKNDIGIVCDDNAEAMAVALKELYYNKENFMKYKENSEKALIDSNLWTHRASEVVKDLGSLINF